MEDDSQSIYVLGTGELHAFSLPRSQNVGVCETDVSPRRGQFIHPNSLLEVSNQGLSLFVDIDALERKISVDHSLLVDSTKDLN